MCVCVSIYLFVCLCLYTVVHVCILCVLLYTLIYSKYTSPFSPLPTCPPTHPPTLYSPWRLSISNQGNTTCSSLRGNLLEYGKFVSKRQKDISDLLLQEPRSETEQQTAMDMTATTPLVSDGKHSTSAPNSTPSNVILLSMFPYFFQKALFTTVFFVVVVKFLLFPCLKRIHLTYCV